MKRKKKYADGGLIEKAAGAINNRQKVLDAAEAAAVGLKSSPPPVALAPKPVTPNPSVLTEAQSKAARFKFERENPGKTYVPPKMANGGYLPFRSQSPFIDSTTPPPQGTPAKPTPGLQNGMYSGYADGGEIGSFFGLPDHAKIATDTWALPKLATGYASGGLIPGSNMWGGANNGLAPMMGGYGGGNAAMLDPARAVSHASGLRTMNRGGVFESMPEEQKQWIPDSPEKQQMYIAAAAANQNAGSTIGGQDIVSSLRKRSNEGMSPMGWNNMVDNMKQGSGGYPMAADGGYVGYADGGAVLHNGLRTTMMLSSGGDEGSVPCEAPSSLGHELGRGWRSGAIMSQSQTRITKFLQSYKDGGEVGKTKVSKPGVITGKGGPTDDKQPILASPGEFIIPADTTAKIGAENLQKLVDQTHEPVEGKGLRNFAGGGEVPMWQRVKNATTALAGKGGQAAAAAQDIAGSAVDAAKSGYDEFKIGMPEAPAGPAAQASTSGVRIDPYSKRPYSPIGARSAPAGTAPILDATPKPAYTPGSNAAVEPMGSAAKPGMIARARAGINEAAGTTGKAVKGPGLRIPGAVKSLAVNALPLYVAQTAWGESRQTPTEDYRKRLGIDRPEGAGPVREAVGDLGVRALGVASDLVNPFNIWGYKDKNKAAAEAAPVAAAPEAPAEVPQAPAAQTPQPDSGDSAYQDIMNAAGQQAQTATAVPAMTVAESEQRAKDTMASMDAANIQKDRLGMAKNDRMRNEAALAQAKYEAEQAASEAKRFKYDPGSRRDAAQKMALYGQAQQVNEGGIDRQSMAMEAPLARAQQTKMGELASKTALEEHRMGLRGQMYGANLGLAQHMADRRLQLYKMRYDMSNMNTEQKEKYINSHPSVMVPVTDKDNRPTGEYKPDPKLVQKLADAVRNAKGSPDSLTPMSEQMPFIDEQSKRMTLDPTGQAFSGAPTQADYKRGMSYKDLSFFHPQGAEKDSAVGLGQYAQSFMPNSLVGAQANATVTLHGYGGRPLIVSAGEYQDAVRKGTLQSLIQKYSTGQAGEYAQDARLQK